ncbi:hypothetical protein [Tardiphaga robiniae]|nr:hypothetical protein [Tardiphaga robiniae]
MEWESLTPNEQAMYRELSKKIDSLKFYVFMLGVFTAGILWKLY